MPIPPLPGELILQILKAGYFNHKFRPDRYFLSTCCRVCRAWAAQAQPLLFRHVEVRRPSSLAGLNEALTQPSHRRNALKDVVLWLRIWIGFSDSASPPEALSFLLANCSNLYGLSVTYRDMWTLPPNPLILPPNVLALECCDWEGCFGEEVSHALIHSGWNSLRILVLRGYPPLFDVSPNLTELRIETTHSQSFPMQDPFPNQKTKLNLRILELSHVSPYLFLFKLSRDSLESVHLTSTFMQPSLLKHCLQVREFKIETFISEDLFHALRDLPLEHLAFSILPRLGPDDRSLECVSLSPTLQVVSCLTSIRPCDEGTANFIGQLEQICDTKHVRLDLYTSLPSFRALTRGSIVQTRTFPRELMVPNYLRLRSES